MQTGARRVSPVSTVGTINSRTPLERAWGAAEEALEVQQRLEVGARRAEHLGAAYRDRPLDLVRRTRRIDDLAGLLHRGSANADARAAAAARIEKALRMPRRNPDRVLAAALGRRLTDDEHRRAAPHLYCAECGTPLIGDEEPPGHCRGDCPA